MKSSILLLLFISLGFLSFQGVAADHVQRLEAQWVKKTDGSIDGQYKEADSSVVFYVKVGNEKVKATYQGKFKPSVMECASITLYGEFENEIFQAVDVTSPCEENIQMATGMRADGKIYVVVAVVLVILTGLLVFLGLTNAKLNKMKSLYEEG